MDTEEMKNHLNNLTGELGAITGGAKRGKKSVKSKSKSRSKSKKAIKKGGAKSKSRKTKTKSKGKKATKKGGAKSKSRTTKSKKTKSKTTKSKKTKSRLSRGLKPALSENLRANKALVKMIGYKGAWSGIMKLVKKVKDTIRNSVKEGDHVALADKTIAALEEYVEKHGKAKVLAEVEKMVEDIRSKRSKK